MYGKRLLSLSDLAFSCDFYLSVKPTKAVTWQSGGFYLLDRAYKGGYNVYGKRRCDKRFGSPKFSRCIDYKNRHLAEWRFLRFQTLMTMV